MTPRLDGLENPEAEPATADKARVLGIAASSEDARRVYFVANAQYDTAPNAAGEMPSPAGRNLYLAQLSGIGDPIQLRFIAALDANDNGVWGAWTQVSGPGGVNFGKTAYASPDGLVFGFASTEDLTGQPTGGFFQLFVYDAKSDTLACASCPSDGTLPAGGVNEHVFEALRNDWQGEGLALRRWISSDGTVFFHTTTPLLAEDENNLSDVYEYRGGELRLVSTGRSTRYSGFSNVSLDGRTVIFNTQDALVPSDKEPGVVKYYAARVGGGFPYVAPTPPCDFNAGACEGAPSAAASVPGAGTAVFEGPGNPKPNRCGRFNKGIKRKLRFAKRAARRGQVKRARALRRQAHKLTRGAKRCRQARRGTNTDRGTNR